LLDPGAVQALGLPADIARTAGDVKDMVTKLNNIYEAEHGEDLFKLTNRSVAAFARLTEVANDLAGYGEFIDNLYVLMYEGSGSGARLGDPFPDVAMDVKVLRTQLRHDVDHGSDGDIRKKRQRAGTTFGKYAGVNSPELVGTGGFPLVQSAILRAVAGMLKVLVPHTSTTLSGAKA
jgi:hypothetical protein